MIASERRREGAEGRRDRRGEGIEGSMSGMSRARRSWAVVIALAVSAGCGQSQPVPAAPAGKATLRLAVIPKALDIPVFNYAKIGAERKAAALGKVQILWNAPATADQLKQKEILESYITQRVDGIAISALNGDFLADTINRAIDAGIPVTTWDSDASA